MLYFAKSTPIGKYPFTKVTSSSVSKSKSSLEIVLNCIVCTPSWMEDFFNVPSSLFTHYLLNSCVRPALFGNAGIFAAFSYVSPILTQLSSVKLEMIPVVLIASGSSMVIFNLLSGNLCAKFTPGKVATTFQCLTVIALLILAVFGSNMYVGIAVMISIAGFMFTISTPEQVAILRCAPGGLLLGAAMIQAAFNLGNALGAVSGGISFRFELPLNLTGVIGAGVACIGAIALFFYTKNHEKNYPEHIESDETLPGNEDYVEKQEN